MRKGFTLIELLLVIAVIASLAGLILTAINPAQRLSQANQTQSKANAVDLEKALETYILTNGGNLPSGFGGIVESGTYDICKNGITGGCISLDSMITSGYLSSIPQDERYSNNQITGLKVKYNFISKNVVTLTQEDYLLDNGDPVNLSSGLIGYWKMDEIAANTCTGGVNDSCDSSGNNNDGAWTGTFSSNSGKYGSAGNFDGGTVYADIGDPAAFDFGTNDFAVTAWAYRNSSFISWDTSVVTKWNTGSSPSSNEWYLTHGGVTTGNETNPNFGFVSGSTVFTAVSSETTANNTWYHLVGIRQGNYIHLYVNGELKASTFIGNVSVNNVSGRTLKIAKIDGGGYGLNGRADEIRIYNRALSTSEVKALYNSAPGPIAHWKFDEGTGTSAADSSGFGNTGTLTNGPTWTTGKYGNAVVLDGTNDYVNIPYTNSLALPTESTVTTWVKTTNSFNRPIMSNRSPSQRTYWGMAGGAPYIYHNTATPGPVTGTVLFNNNTWRHVAYVHNSSGNTLLYVDGILDTSLVQINYSVSSNPYTIGFDSPNSAYLSGQIDDLKIYNYALTQPQIMKAMQEN